MKLMESIYSFLSCWMVKIFRNDTVKQVLSLNYSELKNYLDDLFNNNRIFGKEHKYNRKISYHLVNKYSQLPCTIEAQQKRAFLFEKKGFHDKSILLLGDDDLLSVELSRRYFKKITVIDCDKKLLEKIEKLTEKSLYPVEIIHVDLREGLPDFLFNKFDVVCFDPPQNNKGLILFLNWALRALKEDASYLYIMINCNIFRPEDLNDHLSYLAICGYFLKKKYPSFNSYPLNLGQSLILKLASSLFLNKKEEAKLNYYFSDCLEFEKIENNTVLLRQFDHLPTEFPAQPSLQNLGHDLSK